MRSSASASSASPNVLYGTSGVVRSPETRRAPASSGVMTTSSPAARRTDEGVLDRRDRCRSGRGGRRRRSAPGRSRCRRAGTTVRLVGLDDEDVARPRRRGAELLDHAAVDEARLRAELEQRGDDHARGGGLAVRAGDRDEAVPPMSAFSACERCSTGIPRRGPRQLGLSGQSALVTTIVSTSPTLPASCPMATATPSARSFRGRGPGSPCRSRRPRRGRAGRCRSCRGRRCRRSAPGRGRRGSGGEIGLDRHAPEVRGRPRAAPARAGGHALRAVAHAVAPARTAIAAMRARSAERSRGTHPVRRELGVRLEQRAARRRRRPAALNRCSPLPTAYGTSTQGRPSAASSLTVEPPARETARSARGEGEVHAVAVREHPSRRRRRSDRLVPAAGEVQHLPAGADEPSAVRSRSGSCAGRPSDPPVTSRTGRAGSRPKEARASAGARRGRAPRSRGAAACRPGACGSGVSGRSTPTAA